MCMEHSLPFEAWAGTTGINSEGHNFPQAIFAGCLRGSRSVHVRTVLYESLGNSRICTHFLELVLDITLLAIADILSHARISQDFI